jgi:hypothetical protein
VRKILQLFSSQSSSESPAIKILLSTTGLISGDPDVICASKVLSPVGADVEHHIKMTGPPIAARFPRFDAKKLAAAKAEFLHLDKEGIVRRSDSPWLLPLHMVRKADRSCEPCRDFHRLNLAM